MNFHNFIFLHTAAERETCVTTYGERSGEALSSEALSEYPPAHFLIVPYFEIF